jgi:hypothetical protein
LFETVHRTPPAWRFAEIEWRSLVGAGGDERRSCSAVVCGAPLLDMLRYHKFKVGSWWRLNMPADDPKHSSTC